MLMHANAGGCTLSDADAMIQTTRSITLNVLRCDTIRGEATSAI